MAAKASELKMTLSRAKMLERLLVLDARVDAAMLELAFSITRALERLVEKEDQ